MRQLTKEEKKMTAEGIKRQTKVLDATKRAIKYATAKEKYIKAKNEFEDIATPIEREATKEKFDKEMSELEILEKSTEKIILESNKQLVDGVQEKECPKGVG